MIALEVYAKLTETKLSEFKDKPTSLTQGQKEASTLLWSSADGHCKIGVWECTPGEFTAGRSTFAKYCQIISGSALVLNHDGNGTRYLSPGDLLFYPLAGKGNG